MKISGSGTRLIVLVGMVLLIQTAVAAATSAGEKRKADAMQTGDGKNFKSLDEFRARASKRPSLAQTQELLKKARPDEKIGSVAAKEMLEMDEIGIRYCNLQELNKRNEFCAKKVVDLDLKHYCEDRFTELVKFCADNLDEAVRKAIDQELSEFLYEEYEARAKAAVGGLKTIGADLAGYFQQGGDYYNDSQTPEDCQQFNRQFESVEAILVFAGLDLSQTAKAKGFVEQFEIREFCQAMLAKFGGSEQK